MDTGRSNHWLLAIVLVSVVLLASSADVPQYRSGGGALLEEHEALVQKGSILPEVKKIFATAGEYWWKKGKSTTASVKRAFGVSFGYWQRQTNKVTAPYHPAKTLSQTKAKWSACEREILSVLERVWKRKIAAYLNKNKKYWSRELKLGGTLANFESGMVWMLTLGNSNLENGCLRTQANTYIALTKALKSKRIKKKKCSVRVVKIGIGKTMEHHAVAVIPGSKTKSLSDLFEYGIALDAWIMQKPDKLRSMQKWVNKFRALNAIKGTKFE